MFIGLCLDIDAMVVMEMPSLNSKEISLELSNFLGAMPICCPRIVPNSLVNHLPKSDHSLFKSHLFYFLPVEIAK